MDTTEAEECDGSELESKKWREVAQLVDAFEVATIDALDRC